MNDWRRTIRTTPRKTVRIDDALATVFAAELLDPSRDLWLVSPWVSDVAVLDNADGGYDVLLGDGHRGTVSLSTVLGRIAELGTRLHVAVRPDEHNVTFVDRLTRAVAGPPPAVHYSEDVHEKTLCGAGWVVSGSMNFTWRGFEVNEESVVYDVDPQLAAQARLELEHRWAAP